MVVGGADAIALHDGLDLNVHAGGGIGHGLGNIGPDRSGSDDGDFLLSTRLGSRVLRVRRGASGGGEEEAAGLTGVVPFLVEDSLKQAGARYSKGPDGDSYVFTEKTLVTGQNPASSAATAQRLLDLLCVRVYICE